MISRKTAMALLLFCSLLITAVEVNAQVTVDSVNAVLPPDEKDTAVTDEDTSTNKETILIDTSLLIHQWIYPADSLHHLQQQKEFAYVKNLDSLLKVWQDEYIKNQQKAEQIQIPPRGEGFPVIRFLLWTIAIAVVVFLIYRLFLSERGLFAAPTKNRKLKVEEEPVASEEYLEQQLKEAIRKKNYRLAIRYLYLQTLSKLSDKGWLQLSPDKTNYQYVKELSKQQYRNEFARITLHYEYAWYGDFTIEEDIFKPVKQEFEQFHVKLKQG